MMANSQLTRARSPQVRAWAALLWLGATSVVGCTAPAGDAKGGSETNWLAQCTDDTDCKVGTCLCGACNVECASSSECDGLPLPAACVTAGAAAYPASCPTARPPAGVCLPSCAAQTPCPTGQACHAGLCEAPASATSSLPIPLGELVNAFCAAARTCCAAQNRDLTPLANCESYLTTPTNPLQLDQFYLPDELEPHKFVTLYAQQTITVDEAALSACVSALRDSASNCAAQPVKLCAAAFHGTQAVGAPCRLVEECAQPSNGDAVFCVRPQASGATLTDVGTCTLAPHAQLNDSCHATCDADGVCIGQSGTINVASSGAAPATTACYLADGLRCGAGCQPAKLLGEACATPVECADGLTCANDSRCGTPGALDEPCSIANDCADGLECNAGTCANRSFGSALLCSGTYDH